LVVSGEKLLCRDATEGYVIRIYALDDLMQTRARGAKGIRGVKHASYRLRCLLETGYDREDRYRSSQG
jgi:hypothetical protein